MSEKIMKVGLKREKGWLYYLNSDLNIQRSRMVVGGQRKDPNQRPELVLQTGMKRDPGFLYFVDKVGDIARTKAKRGR